MTGAEKWILGCTIVVTLCGIGALIVAIITINKKQETVISPQPFSVEIVKALHEQFADREIFEKHINNNTQRHAQLFNQIDELAKETRIEMDKRFTDLNDERRRTLEKLNEQFAFIRENVAAINRELQIRGKR